MKRVKNILKFIGLILVIIAINIISCNRKMSRI